MIRARFSLVFSIGVYPLCGYTKYSLALVTRGRARTRGRRGMSGAAYWEERERAKADAPFQERVRDLRFRNALYRLRDYPELQKTLRAIRRHRIRRKIFSALKIGANVYRERFSRLTKILGILT